MAHGTLPTRERLIELREKGEFPCSRVAVRAIMLVGVLVTCFWVFPADGGRGEVAALSEKQKLVELLERLGNVALLLSGSACGAAVLAAVFQTRGRLSFPQWSLRAQSTDGLGGRNVFVVLCVVVVAALTGGGMCTLFLGDIFLLFRREPQLLLADTRAIVAAGSRVLIVVGGVLAILGIVGARVGFMLKHRSKDS